MIRLIRTSNPFSVVLLILYTFLVRCPILFYKNVARAIDYTQPLSFATDTLCKVTPQNIWYHFLTSTIIILSLAFYFNFVLNKNKIVEKNGFLPALLFVLASSLMVDFSLVTNELIAFVIVFISVFSLYNTILSDSNHSGLFDAGFYMGLATLIYKPIFFLVFFLLACVIILRTVHIRDLILTILGFIIPIFLIGTYCFLINRFSLFTNNLVPSVTGHISLFKQHQILEYTKLIVIGIFIIGGILKGQTESIKSIVPIRKFYGICLLLILALLPTLLLANNLWITAFIFFVIPFSFYLYTIVKDVKRMWIAELIHVILLGLIFFTGVS